MRLNGSMVLAGTLCLAGLSSCEPAPPGVEAQLLASHRLPDGTGLGVTVVRVTYGPGESAPMHTHECSIVGYVEYGELRIQLEGDPPAVYHAGEAFYGPAGRAHVIAANASRELPAQFVTWQACEGDAALALAPEGAR